MLFSNAEAIVEEQKFVHAVARELRGESCFLCCFRKFFHSLIPCMFGHKNALAKLRLMAKRILCKHKYPSDQPASTVELVLKQAQVLNERGLSF